MKLTVLIAVVGLAGVAQAQDVRLNSPDVGLRRQLLDERPSFAASVVLLSAGGILGTAGTAATAFGVVMIAASGGSLYSGIAVVLGVIFAIPGAAVMIAGIAMIYAGAQKLRGHIIANEQLEAVPNDQNWHGASGRAAPAAMLALATF